MDTDAAGHHHNTAIVRFVEASEAALMRGRGVSGYFGVVPRVRFEVDFEARLYFGQPVTTQLVLERIGRTSMTFHFEVWGEEFDGCPRQRAASGRYVTAHVPRAGGRAEPWPTAWLTALRATATESCVSDLPGERR
ncbi:acyl-CoA thioesterase [Kribbella sp. NPDC051620]|uniref:acyl-CoA thioesterase n=1 Tax=Kribbella sp. NPDC051620 TaxID=3364120 RepID=UPI0037A96F08